MGARRRGACAGGLLLGLLAACESPPSPADMAGDLPQGSAIVTLGTSEPRRTGDSRWVDLVDGQGVELAPGAQGGFHIWLHYRVQGAAGPVVVKRSAVRVTRSGARDPVLNAQPSQMTFLAGEVFQTEYPIPSFMCPTPLGVNVIDELIELRLRLETPAGVFLGERLARVVARCPPEGDPQRAYCQMICSCAPQCPG